MTSDTPRSDAHYGVLGIKQVRGTERDLFFARTLERELNEANINAASGRIERDVYAAMCERAERAEAKLSARQASPPVPFAYVEHHKGGDNLVWEATNLPCSPLFRSSVLQALLGVAGLDVNKPVAMVVQADQDGSISNEIAPTAWSTYERELGNLKAHPWVLAGAAKIVPLYLHPQVTPSPDVAGLVALLNVQAAFPQDPRHRQVTLDAADALRSLSAQLAAAQAECEGLRQDAEVGKFIRAHLNHGDMSIRVITDVDKHGIPIDGTELIWTDPEDIDAAIDTAIAARKP